MAGKVRGTLLGRPAGRSAGLGLVLVALVVGVTVGTSPGVAAAAEDDGWGWGPPPVSLPWQQVWTAPGVRLGGFCADESCQADLLDIFVNCDAGCDPAHQYRVHRTNADPTVVAPGYWDVVGPRPLYGPLTTEPEWLSSTASLSDPTAVYFGPQYMGRGDFVYVTRSAPTYELVGVFRINSAAPLTGPDLRPSGANGPAEVMLFAPPPATVPALDAGGLVLGQLGGLGNWIVVILTASLALGGGVFALLYGWRKARGVSA